MIIRLSENQQDTHSKHTKWSDEEVERLLEAVKAFGKDYKKITEYVKTQDIGSVRLRCSYELHKHQKNTSLPDAALIVDKLSQMLPRGSGRPSSWSDDEKARFIEAVKLYGKDYEKITEHVATKDL